MKSLKEREKIEENEGIIEKKKSKNRDKFWNIVKGIGIISIVIGHVTINDIKEFVYTYHLIIFFFVAAYFYNEKKYGDEPFKNVGQRIKSTWTKYVFYAMILILSHNLFVEYHFYEPQIVKYNNFNEIIVPLLNTITFKCSEMFGGALWFVPTLLITISLFGGIVYISRNFSKRACAKIKKNKEKIEKYIKYIFILILTILFGILGVFLNENQLSLSYHIHTSFLVIPICTLGYFTREYIDKIKKIKRWYVLIPIMILSTEILIYVIKQGMKIELSKEMIINGYMFYIVSFVGVCFCLSLAGIIEKIPIIKTIIELLGKHSFAIMALHFACAKGVDVIYSKIIGETNPEVISKWVTSYPEKLWILYVFIGCIIPLMFSMILEKLKRIGEKNGEH